MQVLENAEWVEQQFGECDLGDVRRTKRLCQLAVNLLNCPAESLPTQNVEWSDLKAAYRLFARPEVTFDAVAESHWEQTRATPPGPILLISDTTEIDHFTHQATTGLGELGKGDGRGMHLHSCLAVQADTKVVQGLAGARLHYRRVAPKGEKRMARLRRDRESQLWGDLVEDVGPAPTGSQFIHVFDRGGDVYEAMCHLDTAVPTSRTATSKPSRCGRSLCGN